MIHSARFQANRANDDFVLLQLTTYLNDFLE